MKKVFFTALVLISTLSGLAQKNKYMTFQGEIANKNGDAIYITDGQTKNWAAYRFLQITIGIPNSSKTME